MPITYASTPSKLSPTTLSNEVLASIGRLVRAFAEIEDLVLLSICNLAQISESRAVVLIGRAPISRKIEIAIYLANMAGPTTTALFKNCFRNEGFSECIKCRNAVAHGVLLGRAEDGNLAFLTAETIEPTGPSATQIVMSFPEKDIATYATTAEAAIPELIKHLKLAPLRDRRLGQALAPHRKAQSQQQQKKSVNPRINHSGGNSGAVSLSRWLPLLLYRFCFDHP